MIVSFGKSPSVPLGAGWRFNLVVKAHLGCPLHFSVLGPPASGAFYQNLILTGFCATILSLRKRIKNLLWGVLIFSLGCAPLAGKPLPLGSPAQRPGCSAIFPAAPWESVHRIEATIQGRIFSTLLGVTRGEPLSHKLHSLLLTAEGFILFEAELREGEIFVRKAVAPFDSPAFARGLMDDVAFLFFIPPEAALGEWGKEGDGAQFCRWEGPDRLRTEIKGSRDRGWQMVRRDRQGEVIKEIRLHGPFLQGLASQAEVQVYQPVSYALKMTLLHPSP